MQELAQVMRTIKFPVGKRRNPSHLDRLSAREPFINENQACYRQMMTVTSPTFKMMTTTKCTIERKDVYV
jgi:hypothetical protein